MGRALGAASGSLRESASEERLVFVVRRYGFPQFRNDNDGEADGLWSAIETARRVFAG